MKLVLIVERHGTPLGVYGTSAKPSEHRVAEPAWATIRVPRAVAGVRAANHVAWSRIGATTATRCGCDSVVAARPDCPYRCNSVLRQYEDKRKLRRYRKRWKIERSIAWVQNFRRVYVRYDRILTVYLGFVYCACLLIALRHL